MDIQTALIWLNGLVAIPIAAAVVLRLWRLLRKRPDLRVLKERFISASVLTAYVSLLVYVFWNNTQRVPPLELPETQILTRTALFLLTTVPSLYWLYLYKDS